MHLQAIERILKQTQANGIDLDEPHLLQATALELLRAPALPPGFEFLAKQKLLPSEILDLMGPAAVKPNMSNPLARFTMLYLGISAAGIRPLGPAAVEAHEDGHVASYVSSFCLVAAGMFHTIIMAATNDNLWQSVYLDGMEPYYNDLAHLPLLEVLGTLYDEVLLWCLCAYYLTVGSLLPHHLTAFRKLLAQFGVAPATTAWWHLRDLMLRYIYHDAMDDRLMWMLDKEEQHAILHGSVAQDEAQ